MRMEEIKDEQLKEFLKWYRFHYHKNMGFEAALQMSLMERFHLSIRKTRPLLQRCLSLGYLQKAGNACVRIMV